MKDEIRWGIVGPGNIAHSFAKNLRMVNGGRLTAVASRNFDRASSFAAEYGAAHVYGSYQELFESDVVDVLYIATPHTSHCELTLQALRHKKAVLCEKPMGINKQEVDRMVSAAKEGDVFLMEALWSRFNPAIRKVKQLIEEGVIGKLEYLYADFGFYALDRDEKGRLLNPDLAGGSLLDIGIYPIFLSYLFFGMPKHIKASSRFHTTGVEMQTSMLFEYQNGQALLYSGLTSKSEMKAEISGQEGTLFLHPRWHEAQGYSLEKENELTHVDLPTVGKGYSHEIEEVQECLRAGKKESDRWSLQNSQDLVALLDAVRKETGITFPFEE
ncbi:Gfo/Idh/MocA family protein [Maribacter sp. 2307UL18-2]|uniref:Gfo/Idh/MocA family protein n=1 Tax=Maribacter sp. 2307UL18-2 TaxID=3386274 RepID=UPI0039BCA8AF